MKEFKDVRSTVYPQKQMGKTKIRIPSNIREEMRIDENGNEYIEYVYDEVVCNINEFIITNDEDVQNNIDVTMMALDYSYMESSELFDMLMLAMDEMYVQLLDRINRL